jgi:hypothetical protein
MLHCRILKPINRTVADSSSIKGLALQLSHQRHGSKTDVLVFVLDVQRAEAVATGVLELEMASFLNRSINRLPT